MISVFSSKIYDISTTDIALRYVSLFVSLRSNNVHISISVVSGGDSPHPIRLLIDQLSCLLGGAAASCVRSSLPSLTRIILEVGRLFYTHFVRVSRLSPGLVMSARFVCKTSVFGRPYPCSFPDRFGLFCWSNWAPFPRGGSLAFCLECRHIHPKTGGTPSSYPFFMSPRITHLGGNITIRSYYVSNLLTALIFFPYPD